MEGSPTKLGKMRAVNVWPLARDPLEALSHHLSGPARLGGGKVSRVVNTGGSDRIVVSTPPEMLGDRPESDSTEQQVLVRHQVSVRMLLCGRVGKEREERGHGGVCVTRSQRSVTKTFKLLLGCRCFLSRRV